MSSRNRQIALGIFLFLLSVYLASYSGHIHSVDEAYIVAVTANLGKGRLDVNPVAFYQYGFDTVAQIGTVGLSGDVFCKKGIATSFLALPFFWASKLIPGAGAVHSAHLTSGVITAATGSLLFLYLTALGFSNWASLISALTWGIGTIAWPYARWLFTEPAGALALLMSFYVDNGTFLIIKGNRPAGRVSGAREKLRFFQPAPTLSRLIFQFGRI
jgi:hypothetical protein